MLHNARAYYRARPSPNAPQYCAPSDRATDLHAREMVDRVGEHIRQQGEKARVNGLRAAVKATRHLARMDGAKLCDAKRARAARDWMETAALGAGFGRGSETPAASITLNVLSLPDARM